MHIIFGLGLNGYRSIKPENTAGKIVTGPAGLLDILETRLGLGGKWKDTPLRIAEYLHCLKTKDNGHRFYSDSIQADALRVSKTLLSWRDSWVESGWNKSSEQGDHSIISDLAAVETVAQQELSPGTCDRLRRCLGFLEQRGGLDMDISLIELKKDLPDIWQKISSLLTFRGEGLGQVKEVLAEPGTDLARLQNNLLNHTVEELTGDGTVLLFVAHSESVLAKALVQYLYAEQGTNNRPFAETTTLVSGTSGTLFDAALSGQNYPRTGKAVRSHWRPHLQLLPLILDLLWEPLDPSTLLEFLNHPVNPLPAFVCRRLAREVANNPGMGGRDWQKALLELQKKAREMNEEESAAGTALLKKIEHWLSIPRHDPEEGVEIATVIHLCLQVGQWSSGRANSGSSDLDRDLYYAASAQASAASQILGRMLEKGELKIKRLQLNRLLEQVTSVGSPRPDIFAEYGSLHSCDLPEAVVEDTDYLLWWDFTKPALPGKYPWPVTVTRQLRRQGAVFPETAELLRRLTRTWQQPLLRARKRVFFAVPATRRSEPCSIHPLWQQLNSGNQSMIPEINIDVLMDSGRGDSTLCNSLQFIPARPLITPVRWWKVNGSAELAKREKESYSSLQAFLFSPYQWVLRYKACLREGSLNEVQDGAMQQGSLLHLLFEELFAASNGEIQWQNCSQEELFTWIDRYFPEIFTSCGANLLLPGRRTQREELVAIGKEAAWALISHLKKAEIIDIQMERQEEADFFGGRLGGFIDMLVTNRSGKKAVIDLKLGGLKYRRKELSENRQLQLATYAYLRKVQDRLWPAQAFFIFRNGLLLAQDNSFFPDAVVCASGEGENTLSLWQDFEKSWKWRQKQIVQGLIELTVQGTRADSNSEAPSDGIPIEEFNDNFNDFSALTGWTEE